MFIKLHKYLDGDPIRINVAHLIWYTDYVICTSSNIGNGKYPVRENMQEIDKLLGLWEE